MESMNLTKEQRNIHDAVIDGIKHKQTQTVGGYAGTGKSVLLGKIYERLTEKGIFAQVAAPTGKAADVLNRKGLPAATLHSLLYRLFRIDSKKHKRELPDGKEEEYEVVERFHWQRRNDLVANVLLVDESSMISHQMYADLMATDIPCVFFGDHGQLPPVEQSSVNVMAAPDYRLETVHRNAGPIALFCQWVRAGNKPTHYDDDGRGTRYSS